MMSCGISVAGCDVATGLAECVILNLDVDLIHGVVSLGAAFPLLPLITLIT
jgi:hypothetical protein